MLVCEGEAGPEEEVCDGLDNDCNGEVDDPHPLRCGDGVCAVEVPACVDREDSVLLNPALVRRAVPG